MNVRRFSVVAAGLAALVFGAQDAQAAGGEGQGQGNTGTSGSAGVVYDVNSPDPLASPGTSETTDTTGEEPGTPTDTTTGTTTGTGTLETDMTGDAGTDVNVTIENDTAATPPPIAPPPTAQTPTVLTVPTAAPTRVVVREDRGDGHLVTPWGMSLSVGGGVMNFTDDEISGVTRLGGAYDARLLIGTRSPLALEAAYVGAAQDINGLGFDQDALLVQNGVEGNIRLNIGTYALQPFLFGGASWLRYDIVGDAGNASMRGEDDVFAIPMGAGLATMYGGLLVDGRFTYREVYDADLLRTETGSSDPNAELNSWAVTGRIGFEF